MTWRSPTLPSGATSSSTRKQQKRSACETNSESAHRKSAKRESEKERAREGGREKESEGERRGEDERNALSGNAPAQRCLPISGSYESQPSAPSQKVYAPARPPRPLSASALVLSSSSSSPYALLAITLIS